MKIPSSMMFKFLSEKINVVMSWSSGKDCSLALHQLRISPQYNRRFAVTGLLTTITEKDRKVGMHGVSHELVKQQATSIGLPLYEVLVPEDNNPVLYRERMKSALLDLKNKGVMGVAFGDIFLEDLRQRRENNMSELQMQCVFPLWKRGTDEVARDFINSGFKAIITCVDTTFIPKEYVGQNFNEAFISAIAGKADVCGENGEFHTFAYAGPIFKWPIAYKLNKGHFYHSHYYAANVESATEPQLSAVP